jgi:hypothetical protein
MLSYCTFRFIINITLLFILSLSCMVFGQQNHFVGIKTVERDGQLSYETVPAQNNGKIGSLYDHLNRKNTEHREHFVFGGTTLWSAQDGAAIANSVAINNTGNKILTGWGLNDMRVSFYSDANNTPIWNFITEPYDPVVDISGDGSVVAATAGTDFYLLDPSNGSISYQLILPDSFYASAVNVSRDGSMVMFLANAWGSSNTARAYALDLSGITPLIAWTFDVPVGEITNWAGVKYSADGSRVAITGRYHLYVLNSGDGSLLWDHFLDNTESPPAVSGDGKVIVTADNSGFIQTWHLNSSGGVYDLLWQYRVPPGVYSNWASSVGISADGNTILAGSLIFLAAGYDGSVMAFDTYGVGSPKWIYGGVGDLVDDIVLSDDGRVAAAVTWGDYPAHTKADLLVFDVETGDVTFDVVTPGSFFTCDLSPDGKRVIAGGKAVHAREFGNGGRIYLCEIELGGGNISGNVDLTDTGDDSGVIVNALGTGLSAITNVSGNYLMQNIPAGTYTISAGKPGYNFGEITNIVVTEGTTTSGINFSLAPFSVQPPTLSASTNLMGVIMLNWTALMFNPEREKELVKMVGDIYPDENYSASGSVAVNGNYSSDNNSLRNFSSMLADSISIYRSLLAGGPYQLLESVPATENSYVDSNVFALKDYFYVVNVFNETGQSIYSNEALGRVSDTLLTFSLDVPEAAIPTIDGVISSGEWDDAIKLDISDIFGYGGGVPQPQGSVFMYLKFDDNADVLYVAGEDFLNPTLDDNEGFGLYFDDNHNKVFDGLPPFVLEGNFWAYWHPGGSNLRFREIPSYAVDTLFGAEVEFSDLTGHLQGEVAIPMGFMEGYQLQVFGPDKIAGLGAFLIARQGGAALFNGWWPQTMNTVFNPQYFGDVGIDVSLNAPPQAPDNLTITREGNGLLISWNDPALGLNNDPLPVLPEIELYKNGEYYTSINAGIESFMDNDVYCVAWYEYQLKASIQIDTTTLTGPFTPPVGNFTCEEPSLVPISYDDGKWEAFYVPSFSWEENKFAVRFTPGSYPAVVRRLETQVNSNDAFELTIQTDDAGLPGDKIAGPYLVYDTDPATVGTIVKTLPGADPPEILEGDFWVVIMYLEQTPGAPGIGVDVNPPLDNRSFYYLTSTGWQNFTAGDLMITAYVSDQPVGTDRENFVKPPMAFDLKQNYPNPFNPSTVISYQVPESQVVTLEIYNALGQKVRTLVDEVQDAGYYDVVWDAKNNIGNSVTSGIYLYRIVTGNYEKVMKMMLVR